MKKFTCIFLPIFLLSTLWLMAQDKPGSPIRNFENSFDSNHESFAGFRLEPPFEKFTGRSNVLNTSFLLNEQSLENSQQLNIRINVEELKTGIKMVDKYFKEVFMHTKLFPEVVFTLDSIRDLSAPNFQNSKNITGNFYGKLFYHGVTKDVKIPVSMIYTSAKNNTEKESLQIVSEFEVRLADYNVIVPDNLKDRVGETATLFISTICKAK